MLRVHELPDAGHTDRYRGATTGNRTATTRRVITAESDRMRKTARGAGGPDGDRVRVGGAGSGAGKEAGRGETGRPRRASR
ncbi:hypothetical protein GCM10017687_90100 [Streptomyces echinatus]